MLVVVAIAAGYLAGQHLSRMPDADGYVTVPLAVGVSDSLLVVARFGDRPVQLVVDTGATTSLLDAAAAGRVGVAPFKIVAGSATAVNGTTLAMNPAAVAAVWVGPAVVHRAVVGVTDLSGSVARNGAADGVLGADLLNRFGAVIDYHRRTLKVRTAGLRDLAAMQGQWWVAECQLDGVTYRRSEYPNLGNIRAEVVGTHIRIDHSREGRGSEEYHLQLEPDHKPKRFIGSGCRRDGRPDPRPGNFAAGLYEVRPGRFRWLISVTKPLRPDDLPKELVAGPGSGLQVLTFERPPPPLGWHLAGLAARRLGLDRPAGWELSVAPDWTLTGVHPGRGLRLRATPAGHLSVETARP